MRNGLTLVELTKFGDSDESPRLVKRPCADGAQKISGNGCSCSS